MNDSKCAAKLRAQLKRFLGELLPHFSRPKVTFLGDMIYGLMAGGDVKLSSICRAYRPRITMRLPRQSPHVLEVPHFLRELPRHRKPSRGFDLFEVIIVLLG